MKYKAIAKGKWGLPLCSKEVSLRFTIVQDELEVYQESHLVTTNKYGLMDVNIGEGEVVFGIFDEIDWGMGAYSLKVEMDPYGGTNYQLRGDDRLLSVPYALFAGKVSASNDLDGDPTNEQINQMFLSGTLLYTIEGDQTIMTDLSGLQDGFEDDDADPVNEIQVLSLENNILSLTTNGEPIHLDLSPFIDNTDAQQLHLEGRNLSLDNGGMVELPIQTELEGSYYFGDQDGDGYGDSFNPLWLPGSISPPAGFIMEGGDCDDGNVAVYPGASEIASDGIDNDCDGSIDEEDNGLDVDDDKDGFTENEGDCDDGDPSVHPGANEPCGDTVDRNCDGVLVSCSGRLLITEVMSNPVAVSDTYGEWFEIYNPGDEPIHLNGLQLSDNSTNSHTVTGEYIIYPQQSFVFCRNSDPALNGGIQGDYQYSGFTLTNTEDAIILTFPDVGEVARLEYNSAFPLIAGSSIQLDRSQYDASNLNDPGIWCASSVDMGLGDTGTPGAMNSSCGGE
jgi:hypothetical protein